MCRPNFRGAPPASQVVVAVSDPPAPGGLPTGDNVLFELDELDTLFTASVVVNF